MISRDHTECLNKCIQILMRNLSTEEVYLFTYENWLSKTKGPKRVKVCELPAVVDDDEMVEKTTYIIQVQTSDVRGGSLEFGTVGSSSAPNLLLHCVTPHGVYYSHTNNDVSKVFETFL